MLFRSRPDKKNALTRTMYTQLAEALEQADAYATDHRARLLCTQHVHATPLSRFEARPREKTAIWVNSPCFVFRV